MTRRSWSRSTRVVATALAATTVLAACAGGGEPETGADGTTPLTMTLQWVTQASFAGYYAALDLGYYAEEGIDMTIRPGGPDVSAVQLLQAGETDIALTTYSGAASSADSGADIVTIASLAERSATTLLYFSDQGDLSQPSSWVGRTVGLWGGFSSNFAAAVGEAGYDLDRDFTVANQGFDMSGLLSGEYDLAEAKMYNEYGQALAGADGREISVVSYDDLGASLVEEGIVVSPEWLADNPELAAGFLDATARGWIHCRDNPEECVDIVLEHGTALPRDFQLWQLNEYNKLMWPSTSGVLSVSPELIEQSNEILESTGVVSSPVSPDLIDFSARDTAVADYSDEDLHGYGFTPLDIDVASLTTG